MRSAGSAGVRWALAAAFSLAAVAAPALERPLRVALRESEPTFDPATLDSAESAWLIAQIMQPPLRYDSLSRPRKLRLQTAAAMPEVSADRLNVTIRLRPGIRFADDPAFGGKARELTAADYVYTLKRHADPAVRSTQEHYVRDTLAGFDAAYREALKTRRFDYDRPLEGARAVDRYTLQLTLTHPVDITHQFANCVLLCALAREVVAKYGDRIAEHPVGTGPYRLAEWRRGSRVVLERNPNFGPERYDERPEPGDRAAEATAERLRGRELPLVSRVELSVITESQPRWLAFENSEIDFLFLPGQLIPNAIVDGHLRPELQQRGITLDQAVESACVYFAEFNMDDSVVGGYTPEKVALRRAIALALNVDDEIRVMSSGTSRKPVAVASPTAIGVDPAAHVLAPEYDPAKARAMLDAYGYKVNGDGWRVRPDGGPLTIELLSFSVERYRALDELWMRDLKAIGLKVDVIKGEADAVFRRLRAGTFMVDNSGFCAGFVGVYHYLFLASKSLGGFNSARFHLPQYDALFERAEALPPGPEQARLMQEMDKLVAAYAPRVMAPNPVIFALAHKGVLGLRADSDFPALARIGFE